MKTYYRNQLEVADALVLHIDAYWNDNLSDEEITDFINVVVKHNKNLIFKNNKYASAIEKKVGKKRLGLMERILSNSTN